MTRFFLLIVILAAAVPALIWGSGLKTFSTLKLLVFFGPVVLVLLYVLLNRRPAWAMFTAALILLPGLGLIMPPARLRMDAFNYLSILLLILAMQTMREERPIRFFDASLRPFWMALLCLLPSALFAFDPQRSAVEWTLLWGYYAALLVGVRFLSVARNVAIAHNLLVVSLAVVSLAILVQKLANVSFGWLYSERGLESTAGMLIVRGSGLFQDPQKAGQFIAVLAAYLAIAWQRHALPRGVPRWMVPATLILALPALFLTVSRLAIVAGMFFAVAGMFLLGRQSVPFRIMARTIVIALLAAAAMLWGTSAMIDMLPEELQHRTLAMDESLAVRFGIWAQSFNVFLENPLTGIGLGNYQAYFLADNPAYITWQGGPGRAVVPTQPESGYLKILYEVGAIGSLAILVLAGHATRMIMANIRSPVPEVSSRAWSVAAAMGAFLITFVTLFTTSDARNALLPIIFLALIHADSMRDTRRGAMSATWSGMEPSPRPLNHRTTH